MFTLRLLIIEWSVAGAIFPANIFTVQVGFATHELTHMLDSLVRVSRRGERSHVVNEQSMCKSSRHIHPPMGQATISLPLSLLGEPTLIDRARSTTHDLLKACYNIARRSRQAH